MDLSGVARVYPPQTLIMSIEMDLTEVAQGGLELELHEEEEEDDKYIEVILKSSISPRRTCFSSSECNSSAMLTSWDACPLRP